MQQDLSPDFPSILEAALKDAIPSSKEHANGDDFELDAERMVMRRDEPYKEIALPRTICIYGERMKMHQALWMAKEYSARAAQARKRGWIMERHPRLQIRIPAECPDALGNVSPTERIVRLEVSAVTRSVHAKSASEAPMVGLPCQRRNRTFTRAVSKSGNESRKFATTSQAAEFFGIARSNFSRHLAKVKRGRSDVVLTRANGEAWELMIDEDD